MECIAEWAAGESLAGTHREGPGSAARFTRQRLRHKRVKSHVLKPKSKTETAMKRRETQIRTIAALMHALNSTSPSQRQPGGRKTRNGD